MNAPTGVRALLFDLDGTLVDSKDTVDRHTRLWARRHNLDPEMVIRFSEGRPDVDFIPQLVPYADAPAEIAWLHGLSCIDVAGVTAIPGAKRLLGRLPSGAWGIVTSAAREVAVRRIQAAGLPQPELLVAAEDVANGKPAPDGYRRALDLLGVPPEQAIAFEDAHSGIDAARAAGLPVVVVGHSPHADLPSIVDLREVEISAGEDGYVDAGLPSGVTGHLRVVPSLTGDSWYA